MRKYLLFIAVLFVAAALSAQFNVWSGGKIIYSPDEGVQVDSITFVHAEPVVTEITFDKLKADNYTNNWALTFTESKTNTILALDVYGESFKYMPAGTYVFGATEGNRISSDAKYTYLTRGEQTVGIKDCQIDVSVDVPNAIYTIVGTLTSVDGDKFQFSYVGAVEGLPIFDKYNVVLTAAKRVEANPQTDGRYYLKFNDADWSVEMTCDFYADPTSSVLPAGSYTIGESTAPGNINAATSSISFYSGHPVKGEYFKSGKIDVSITPDGKYTFILDIVDKTDQGFTGTFTLDVADMKPEVSEVDYVFETLSAEIFGTTNWTLTFADTETGDELVLDVYGESFKYMPAGTYVLGATAGSYVKTDITYTHLKKGENNIALTAGQMLVEVDIENAIYKISGAFTPAEGEEFTFTYEGEAKRMPVFDKYNVELTAAKRVEANPQTDGRYYLKFNNSAWTVEMTCDFHADPTSSALPAGTYTIGESTEPGSVNAATSSISLYNPHPVSGGYFKSGTIIVEVSDGQYTFTLDVVDKTDQGFTGTFTLNVANMDLSE